ncbi:MAG: acylphosphatase [Chloroflexi bacterium]|nr:acylphosphatase [Chloroflexota bacterium]
MSGDPLSARVHRIHVVLRGRVQGVYFRQSAQEMARRLGLSGWVRNNSEGSVEAVAEGPRDALEQFVAWCRRGPPGAYVQEADLRWEIPTGEFHRFDVRAG